MIEATEGIMKKIICDSMIKMIDELKFNKGFELFKVEENFPLHDKRTYLIRNLNVSIEDDACCCSDLDNLILKNFYVLSGFLLSEIINIVFLNIYTSKIIFNDGYVTIQAGSVKNFV